MFSAHLLSSPQLREGRQVEIAIELAIWIEWDVQTQLSVYADYPCPSFTILEAVITGIEHTKGFNVSWKLLNFLLFLTLIASATTMSISVSQKFRIETYISVFFTSHMLYIRDTKADVRHWWQARVCSCELQCNFNQIQPNLCCNPTRWLAPGTIQSMDTCK